jgi:hypothetical protein
MADSPVVSRARALTGTRFRLHGRDPATGLDCVGLVARAADARGILPTGYALRGGAPNIFVAIIDTFATRRRDEIVPGDILLIQIDRVQFHLGVWTGNSLIHAHAGLRRVVETPGSPEGAIIAAWHVNKG